MSPGSSRFRRRSVAALLPFVLVPTTNATWSIVIADSNTKEVAIGTVTCLTSFDLLSIVPVVVVGKGAAAVQSAGDFAGIRRPLIFDDLIAGVPPDNMLAIVAGVPGHQDRQYGMADTQGRTVTFSGALNAQWAGGVTGTVGTISYAIQGNIMTGGCVIPAIEQAVRNTVGDVPAKLMAGMQAASAAGGDGRCSCEGTPTSCGCPPSNFTKPGHIGGMIVARIGDADDVVCNASGCADGNYFLRINVPFQSPSRPNPVDQLQDLFDAWRANLSGRPDAIHSQVTFDPPGPVPAGASTTMRITPLDWQGAPTTVAIQSLTVEHALGSDAVSAIGPVMDNGDGSFAVVVTAGASTSTDRFTIAVDDGVRPVILMPETELQLLGPMPTDDCTTAPMVGEGVFPVNTAGATTDGPDEPLLCDDLGDTQVASDVWLCYTPSFTGPVTASLCGSAYDTKMAVYDGCACPSTESATACNNDSCGTQSEITFQATAGQGVMVRIGGHAGAQGSGTLTITRGLEACCLTDGTCDSLRAEDCLASGGTARGAATSCDTTMCPPSAPQPLLIPDSLGNLVEGRNNRFLSFTAGAPGSRQAIRVTMVDLPPPFDPWNGIALWVGQPAEVSEGASVVAATADFPSFHAAGLRCDSPAFLDWGALGLVHVFHEGIVPGGSYRVEVVDVLSSIVSGDFSQPLSLTTGRWGDLVGQFVDGGWTAQDDVVGVASDVIAMLDKFANRPGAPTKARADLEPRCLDLKNNITDVVRGLDAFSGASFPFKPTAGNPCDSTCANPLPMSQ